MISRFELHSEHEIISGIQQKAERRKSQNIFEYIYIHVTYS